MKKRTAFYAVGMALLLSLASSIALFGQESHGSVLLNMVNSRMNYGGLNGTLRGYKKDVQGLQAGLSWQAGITKRFSVVTEAYFVKKGGALTATNPVNSSRSTLKLRTIEIPVLARFHAGAFYFNAGPYLNYLLAGRESSGAEGSHRIAFGKDEYRKVETGFQGGGGYQFRVRKRRMAVDVRYTSGISSVSRKQELYSRTLNISLIVLRSPEYL